MAFGFPAYHTSPQPVPIDGPPGEAVRAALRSLGWTLVGERDGEWEAKSGLNTRSWGERITIRRVGDAALTLTSRCVWPLQCIDLGRNQSNVERFIGALRTPASV